MSIDMRVDVCRFKSHKRTNDDDRLACAEAEDGRDTNRPSCARDHVIFYFHFKKKCLLHACHVSTVAASNVEPSHSHQHHHHHHTPILTRTPIHTLSLCLSLFLSLNLPLSLVALIVIVIIPLFHSWTLLTSLTSLTPLRVT
jgi:hypothetical protein